jgi:tetratricopeptide (TPR) repeat protein
MQAHLRDALNPHAEAWHLLRQRARIRRLGGFPMLIFGLLSTPQKSVQLFAALGGLVLGHVAFAAGGGSMGGTSDSAPMTRELSPQEIARNAYNDGVRAVKQATRYEEDAAEATKDQKRIKAGERAKKQFDKARSYFALAINKQPAMHEAWNYIGYTSRKLGDMDKALAAYGEALRLKPDYAEAIEYRGVAYLALNRLDDAKSAYMSLFRDNRKLAAQLMTEMQSWVATRRAVGSQNSQQDSQLDAFAQWINERASIAQQTASLAVDAPSLWQ